MTICKCRRRRFRENPYRVGGCGLSVDSSLSVSSPVEENFDILKELHTLVPQVLSLVVESTSLA